MAKRPSVLGDLVISQDAEQKAEFAAPVGQLLPQHQAQDAPATPPKAPEKQRKPDPRLHTSIYVDRAVMRKLREIALASDRRPHDLIMEGIDLVLEKHGFPSGAEISRKGKA